MTDKNEADYVISSAKAWWENKRPKGWSLDEHLASPKVYTASEQEALLAARVADLIRKERGVERSLAAGNSHKAALKRANGIRLPMPSVAENIYEWITSPESSAFPCRSTLSSLKP